MKLLEKLLNESSAMHKHLCPKQVLGVRMGLLAGKMLNIKVPQSGKRLLTIAETDGCAADGIAVATNCWVGHRTLRIEDYGKVAATFVDTESGRALRIVPRSTVRDAAREFAQGIASKWEQQLIGYQQMPDADLLVVTEVELIVPIEKLISKAGRKTNCHQCGEEVINEREVRISGRILCRACWGETYYRAVSNSAVTSERTKFPNYELPCEEIFP